MRSLTGTGSPIVGAFCLLAYQVAPGRRNSFWLHGPTGIADQRAGLPASEGAVRVRAGLSGRARGRAVVGVSGVEQALPILMLGPFKFR